ncbi:MAG: hypothetical protein AAGN46_18420 [Acidobacteriota bacterium]
MRRRLILTACLSLVLLAFAGQLLDDGRLERALTYVNHETLEAPLEAWRTQPILATLASGLRGRLVTLGVIAGLLIFGLIRLRRRLGERWTDVAIAALSVVAAWMAVELLAAPFLLTRLGLYEQYFVLDVDHLPPVSHPAIGTNSLALRSPYEPGDGADARRILMLGDSYAFGFRVGREEAFPARLDALLDGCADGETIVVNGAWTSASPVLALRRLPELGRLYRPDLIIYALDVTDFHDDLKYTAMLERRGLYATYPLVPITLRQLRTLAPGAWRALYRSTVPDVPLDRFFVLHTPLSASAPLLETTAEALEAIAAHAAELEAEMLVVALPRPFHVNPAESPHSWERDDVDLESPHLFAPFRWLSERWPQSSAGRPFETASLLEAFRRSKVFPTAFDDDPHWTPAGHEVAARALLAELAPDCVAAPAQAPAAARDDQEPLASSTSRSNSSNGTPAATP